MALVPEMVVMSSKPHSLFLFLIFFKDFHVHFSKFIVNLELFFPSDYIYIF